MEQRFTEPVLFNLKDESYSDDEDTNLVEIKLSTKTIQVSFLQLYKYSPLFRDKFVTNESRKSLSSQIIDFQNKFNIREDNMILFFKLIQEESISIKNDSYYDLRRLSDYFQTKKIHKLLDKYSKSYLSEIDSIVIQILDSQKANIENGIIVENVNDELETKLSSNLNECFQNDLFKTLPISIIYRIISKSDLSNISSNSLFDFINESVEERYPLFHFLRIKELSTEKYDMLYENSKKEVTPKFIYQNIPIDLEYIKSLKDRLSSFEIQNNFLQSRLNEAESECNNLQSQLNDLNGVHQNLKNDYQKLQNHSQQVEQERDNLKKYDKAFSDRIRAIIPDRSDDERVNIVDRDAHLSNNIRSILPNNSDNQIIGFVGKDTKLSIKIRGFFKSGDDSWITKQIEDNHNQVKIDANLKNEINEIKEQNKKLKEDNQKLQNENNDIKNQIVEFNEMVNLIKIEHDPNKEFNGIFSYLKKQLGQDIFNDIIITASSTFYSYYPKNVINYNDSDCYYSQNIENSWISFQFKRCRIIPTSYTVKATESYFCPLNWSIEGSNDNNNWCLINEQKNCHCIELSTPCTFDVNNTKPFQFIRMKMNGKNSGNKWYHLIIESFEIYGTLITIS